MENTHTYIFVSKSAHIHTQWTIEVLTHGKMCARKQVNQIS